MYPYRKILELHADNVSFRSIVLMTNHSRQKVTEIIELAKQKGVKLPIEEEMTDPWLEDFLYPEKKQEASGRHLINAPRYTAKKDKTYSVRNLMLKIGMKN